MAEIGPLGTCGLAADPNLLTLKVCLSPGSSRVVESWDAVGMYRDRAMRCDRCQTDLEQYGVRDKWHCKTCQAVVIGSSEAEAELGDLGAGLAEPLDTSRLVTTARACPTCDTGMNQLAIEGVVIERCPKDFTLWFDAGELGKIRTSIANDEASPVLLRIWERYFSNLDH